MKKLIGIVQEAKLGRYAIGHFNVSNLEGIWAIAHASKKTGLPAIIGASEGEREFVGAKALKAIVGTLQSDGYEVYLNADHSYSLKTAGEAIELGYDSVIIDAADKSLEDNIALARSVVEKRNSLRSSALVEAELGYIGKSSKVLDSSDQESLSNLRLTEVDEALRFVSKTGVDLFAPAVGNIHGIFKGGVDPRLDIPRIKAIADAVKIPLVLHGGSGNEADFAAAIDAGISIIHINTELRVAFRKGLERALAADDGVAPYKYLGVAREAMQRAVEVKMLLFARRG